MASSSEEEYAAFLEKVNRTIYVDNLSPQVTEAIMKAAFDQFGNVNSVEFIPNYFEAKSAPQAALVEMENPKQAREILIQMTNFPLMISGMPRPVRACAAKLEMFDNRPQTPGQTIMCRWLDPQEPDFEVAKKIKHLVGKHAAEAALVLEKQREEEQKLANKQAEALKAHYRKYELIEGVLEDGTARDLARHYKVNVGGS